MANLKNTSIDNNLELPQGTTAQRPSSPEEGQIRYNTDISEIEIYNGSYWQSPSVNGVRAEGGFVFDTEVRGKPFRIHYFSTKFKYLSGDSGSVTGGAGGGLNDTVKGESDARIGGCSGLVTFDQALQLCHSNGVRLPTREEVIQGVAEGTGCGYDNDQIWTCDKADPLGESHWTIIGDWPRYGYSTDIRDNTETAYVRWAADVDLNRLDPNWIDDPYIYNWLKTNYPDQIQDSTTFTVTQGGNIEYLIIAGGGSGGVGTNGGGGGGAGGVIAGTTTVSAQTYTFDIGLGGERVFGRGIGQNGEDTTAFGLTAVGGGYGGGKNDRNGNSGGSGGGGDYANSGQSGTSGQGNSGGTGNYDLGGSHDAGGGGGGAGANGLDASQTIAGRGGPGIGSFIFGFYNYYAGGGGAASNRIENYQIEGSGGLGGGGIGGISSPDGSDNETCRGFNGTPGKGGGGGAGAGNSKGEAGAGGSGAVIVAYPKNESTQSSPNVISNFTNSPGYSPVRDNLIFHLDFSNPLCYPGYKNTATDLHNFRQGSVLSIDQSDTPYLLSASNGIYFTTNEQWMDFENPFQGINMFTEAFTISHWVFMNHTREAGFNYQLFSRLRHDNDSYYGYKFGRDGSDQLGFSLHQPDLSNRFVVRGENDLPTGEWVFCTVVKEEGNANTSRIRLYVNDSQETISEEGWTLSFPNEPGTIRLGGRSRTNGGDENWYLNGRLGTTLMYNRALTTDEVVYNFYSTKTGGI